jgi:hypothetical protein
MGFIEIDESHLKPEGSGSAEAPSGSNGRRPAAVPTIRDLSPARLCAEYVPDIPIFT